MLQVLLYALLVLFLLSPFLVLKLSHGLSREIRIKKLLEAIEKNPRDPRPHIKLGQIYMTDPVVRRGMQTVPTLREHPSRKMTAWERAFRKKVDLALREFERAIVIAPQMTQPYEEILRTMIRTGRENEKAYLRRILKKAVRYHPDHPQFLYDLGVASTGSASIDYLERTLEQDPTFHAAVFQLGVAWQEMGAMDRAERYFMEYMKKEPAGIYRGMAEEMLKEAQEDSPESWQSRGAMPSIIETQIELLRDEDEFTRMGAISTLESLTSETLDFDAFDSDSERRRAIKRWESWWEENRVNFETL